MARGPIRSNFAAARMSRAPATSASSRSPARAPSRPACAASRPRPAMTPASASTRRRARSPKIASALRAPVAEAGERLAALIEERRKLERELSDARRKLAMGGGGAAGAEAVREVAGVKLYARAVSGVEMKDLKSMADEAKQSLGSGVVAIVALAEDGKASVVVAVTNDLATRHQRRRSRAHRLRRARRQGRGRAPRYGAGRRSRRRQGRSRAGGDRSGAARQSGVSPASGITRKA